MKLLSYFILHVFLFIGYSKLKIQVYFDILDLCIHQEHKTHNPLTVSVYVTFSMGTECFHTIKQTKTIFGWVAHLKFGKKPCQNN